jgi:mono/diheme cytochrome c family protein
MSGADIQTVTMTRPRAFFAGIVLVGVLGSALLARAQVTTPPRPPLVISSLAGSDLYQFYCATCHGRDGRGQGPVAAALKVAPPDLTGITRRHGGTFPRGRVEDFVTNDGDTVTLALAHGTRDMPVWGPVFRGLDPSDKLVKVRIANVVQYIESIQEK